MCISGTIVGVQGGHEVPSEGRLHGDLRGFAVADYHNHVGSWRRMERRPEAKVMPARTLSCSPDAVNAVFDLQVVAFIVGFGGWNTVLLPLPVGPVDGIMP